MSQLAKAGLELGELEPEIRERPQRKKQRTFKLSRSKLPTLVILFLLVYLAFTFSSQFSSIASMQRDVRSIEQEITDLKQRNEFLHGELRNMRSDANIEKAAREQLGLVKAGETRVIVTPADQLNRIQ